MATYTSRIPEIDAYRAQLTRVRIAYRSGACGTTPPRGV